MNKDKQIEEMAKQLYGNFGLTMPTARSVATYLTKKKGYRKSEEVALEVIGEIEEIINKHYNKNCFKSVLDDIEIDAIINFSDDISHDLAELKKKYESEKDNG